MLLSLAGAAGVNSLAIDDECNAARGKKSRFHGTSWIVIGIRLCAV
jgi:hypothetical protein